MKNKTILMISVLLFVFPFIPSDSSVKIEKVYSCEKGEEKVTLILSITENSCSLSSGYSGMGSSNDSKSCNEILEKV